MRIRSEVVRRILSGSLGLRTVKASPPGECVSSRSSARGFTSALVFWKNRLHADSKKPHRLPPQSLDGILEVTVSMSR